MRRVRAIALVFTIGMMFGLVGLAGGAALREYLTKDEVCANVNI